MDFFIRFKNWIFFSGCCNKEEEVNICINDRDNKIKKHKSKKDVTK